MMRIRSVAATHTGLVRKNNEDSYIALDEAGILAVADGMGGAPAGEVASALAVHVIGRSLRSLAGAPSAQALKHTMGTSFNFANDVLLADGNRHREHRGMGTTLTVGLVRGGLLFVGHAGDSALFLVRGACVERLTSDQTVAGAIEATGRVADPDWRGVLGNALGGKRDTFQGAELRTAQLRPYDVIVLLTDGVLDYFCDVGEIARIIAGGPFANAADRLVRHALDAGGHDNATAVVARVIE